MDDLYLDKYTSSFSTTIPPLSRHRCRLLSGLPLPPLDGPHHRHHRLRCPRPLRLRRPAGVARVAGGQREDEGGKHGREEDGGG